MILYFFTILGSIAAGAILLESFYATRERRALRDRRRSHASVIVRARLTVEGARQLGLEIHHVPTPWSIDRDTYVLAPTPHAPCQTCWHRRDEHAEDAETCLASACACSGWDPFLDTAERATRGHA